MALRHYQGSIQEKPAAWSCPSCGRSNTTPLEQGCACGVGRDAKVAAQAQQVVEAIAERRDALSRNTPGIDNAFDSWYATGPEEQRDLAWKAFVAGATWAMRQRPENRPDPDAVRMPTGGYYLRIVGDHEGVGGDGVLVDARTQQTILAALRFYAENQLVYGAVAGQLDVEEVKGLIAKLEPQVKEEGEP
jgi:hypothetical protein